MPCPVPGDVHMALMDAGIIEDPLVDKNSEECRWMEQKEFWYVTSFDLADDDMKTCANLCFEGLDTTADIWLNDIFLGRRENAFVEHTFDVSDKVKKGSNTLIVRIDQGLQSVLDKPLETMELMWNNDQPYRVWMRKPQFVYSWDWTVWLTTIGIWKPVTLTMYQNVCMEDIYVHSEIQEGTTDGNGSADVIVEMEFSAANGTVPSMAEVKIFGDDTYGDEELIAAEQISFDIIGTVQKKVVIPVKNPKLWWCNQYGNPYRYRVEVSLYDEQGQLLEHNIVRHGIRKVTLQELPLPDGRKSFTFVINGEPVFAKGANHVPCDCFPGRITAEKEFELIRLAASGNMNMLRVWGGGVYSSDAFMEACDQYGIMVWHDFMFACGFYPDHDDAFCEEVKEEAIKAVKRLRNHASLIGWSGNNEIHSMYESMKDKLDRWYGYHLYHELLPNVVKEYCGDLLYRPCSPYGEEHDTNSIKEGDQHSWAFTHIHDYEYKYDLWRFTDEPYLFLSEFGLIGAMNLESAKKSISKEHLYVGSDEWRHHSNNYIDFEVLNEIFERYWGDKNQYDLQQYILRSQVVQAEITRHIYDEFRCRKYECSGLLFWTLGDSMGIHNWSILDYYLGKRPIYHYLKRSLVPVALTIRGFDVQTSDGEAAYFDYFTGTPAPLEIWAVNDTREDKSYVVNTKLMLFDGTVLKEQEKTFTIGKNSSNIVDTLAISGLVSVPEKTICLTTLLDEQGLVVQTNKYLFAPFRKLLLEKASIQAVQKKLSDGIYQLELSADTFVWMLHLKEEDGVWYSDNNFDLLPGEQKVVEIHTTLFDWDVPEFVCINEQ